MLESTPEFNVREAAEFAREHFGVSGRAEPLTSERDQNFRIIAPDQTVVLKIANARELRSVLDAQAATMQRLHEKGVPVPRVLDSRDRVPFVEVSTGEGQQHFVWMVSELPGVPLAHFRNPPESLHTELGAAVGAVTAALDGFEHPGVRRSFHWDLATGRATVEERLRLIRDAELRRDVEAVLSAFDQFTAPALKGLRRAVIHGDLNDYNILISRGDGVAPRLSGFVDLGDMVYSYAIADLAVAAAYAVLDAPDPLTAMLPVVRAYHGVYPLSDSDFAALFGLMALRLCLSVCLAEEQVAARPGNEYLAVSQVRVRAALPRIARTPFGAAEAVLRDACGLEPVRGARALRDWLAARTGSFAPVLGIDLAQEPSVVLDLSVGSPLVSSDPAERDEPSLTAMVDEVMRQAGVKVAVGRYDEPRVLYLTPQFSGGGRLTDERRTIHIGLDLFAPAGTPVFAPLSGTVYSFADNAMPLDYGPTVILRHETGDGAEFFTLYGHLARESLRGLRTGAPVERGARVGWLGAPDENGGWTPHLHVQVMAGMLGLTGNFPGVALATQRRAWVALCPDPNLLVGIPAERFPPEQASAHEVMVRRRERLGGNLSVAYAEPIQAVRGWRQYLYDDTGRQYVDAFNNVPHVGHSHPAVVAAVAGQMRVLNTNTRYLHSLRTEYADRLVATLPEPLRVCYFTNSASEANELALRLARAATGARDMVVLEAAYHGNTTTLIDLSPYKHAGPGGQGAPDWVHVAPLPDDYRGKYRRGEPDVGRSYADELGTVIREAQGKGRRVAGFIAETCPSVGGQIMLPAGYLAEAYAHVRAAGGLCIADEVQTGLGRIGTHCWAFEAQGIVPDIVVMGKPMGNGHPLAAVVTTRAVADAFDNGMEYFSTFGGNTVSCAAGLAVLDVMEAEHLQEHAREVGAALLHELNALMPRHEIVGDVRGSGFFIGVELVRDRESRAPAANEARYVSNRLRERGVLIGTDGPYHNVLKIRPPMPFDGGDSALLIEALDEVLGEIGTPESRDRG